MIGKLFAPRLLIGILSQGVYAQCDHPKYRKGIVWEDTELNIAMFNSMKLDNFVWRMLWV
jgi:hypothetical protein